MGFVGRSGICVGRGGGAYGIDDGVMAGGGIRVRRRGEHRTDKIADTAGLEAAGRLEIFEFQEDPAIEILCKQWKSW